MFKVFLNAGHGGSDPGAVGYVVEKEANLKMTMAAKDYLEARGIEVMMTDADLQDKSETSNEIISACNEYEPDVALDIHNNAGKGKGFEVYHTINARSLN